MKWDIAVDNMDRKKQLKEQYKQMKTDMGVFMVKKKNNNKYLLIGTQNLNGMMNRVKFQLENGSYTNGELQKDWNESSPDDFEFTILETLEYDKDEFKIDYSEEVNIILIMLTEKLLEDNMVPYRK